MKKLEIKQNGILHRIAKFGGFPEDGEVRDKEAELSNNLVSHLFDTGQITREERAERQRREWKDADFCHFVRYVLAGCFWSVFMFLAGSLLIFLLWSEIAWVGKCLLAWKWQKLEGPALGGVFITSLAAALGVYGGIGYLLERLKEKKDSVDKRLLEVYALEAKLNRIEVRKAFWASVKNKTCYRMEIK